LSDAILSEFDAKADLFLRITAKAALLIEELLVAEQIAVHSVTYRTKQRKSLVKKLSKPGRSYKSIRDVTDIVGIRIITYFEDDVDRVSAVLEREFAVDKRNSIDRRLALDPDRFGYVSIHHVVRLNRARAKLYEYRFFDQFPFEIQTRSILQHAWAEIEHDLGYKSTNEVPRAIRRRFSRLAGLLELADTEFNTIRTALSSYDQEVAQKIQVVPNDVEINKNSLIAFLLTNPLVHYLDEVIAKAGKWNLVDAVEGVSSYIEYLNFVGVHTIGSLNEALSRHSNLLHAFAMKWLEFPDEGDPDDNTIEKGIAIFYLVYIILAEQGDKSKIVHYADLFDIGDSPEGLAASLLNIYKQVAGHAEGGDFTISA
jgi:ppGpp synthetase/RelA/SpoT-type nucleotidyltranferase